jgi:hypothetical protein
MVSFDGYPATSIFVQNTDTGGGDLLVSFDGGTTFKTLANRWDYISIDARLLNFVIKTSSGTKSYEALVSFN